MVNRYFLSTHFCNALRIIIKFIFLLKLFRYFWFGEVVKTFLWTQLPQAPLCNLAYMALKYRKNLTVSPSLDVGERSEILGLRSRSTHVGPSTDCKGLYDYFRCAPDFDQAFRFVNCRHWHQIPPLSASPPVTAIVNRRLSTPKIKEKLL